MALRSYGSIDKWKDGRWAIKCEPHVSLRVKDVFRQVDKTQVGVLLISDNAQICKDILWFMQRYPLNVSNENLDSMKNKAFEYDKNQEDMEKILLPDYKPNDTKLLKPLRHYQAQAVDLLVKKKKYLCGDDVGLGKTVVGIGGVIAAPDALPALIVCQAHLPIQWKEKFNEFASNLRIHIVKSRRPYSLPEADIYIMGYSKIIGWDDLLLKGFFKSVVFDECQELRLTGSIKYQSSRIASEKANYVLGLSATPVYNYGGEIYSIMNLINEGCLGRFDEFTREWCGHSMYENKVKVKDPKALGAYLRENHLLLRRTRVDVQRELPMVNKIVQEVEYDENYAERAEKELKEIAARVITGSFIERGVAARQLDSKARMVTGIAKAHSVADYVSILLENKEKVLLAGWHREVYKIWEERFKEYKPVFYTGSESPSAKEKAKQAFIGDETNIMIISLRSGIGLDGLQDKCSLVVFGELDWSPGVHEQVTGRVHRDGQQKSVTSIFLTSSNGTDPLMVDVLGLKASQASGIMNPSSDILEINADDDRIKKLAHNILGK